MIDFHYPHTVRHQAYHHFERDLHGLLEKAGIDPFTPGLPYATQATAPPPDDTPDPPSRAKTVGLIVEFIDKHLDEALTLDQLSERARLSKYHFARLFRDETGMTPWAYVLDTRLRKARALLDHAPHLSLAEIALLAGFYDQSHFTNTFKKAEGLTPGRYRRQRKDLQDREADEG
ncbi:MAG: helix-turn-helix transcriptional regulator [Rhodothermales bacterium]